MFSGADQQILDMTMAKPLLDLNHLEELITSVGESERGFVEELCSNFYKAVGTLLNECRQLDLAAGRERIKFILHKTRGSAGTIGAARIYNLCGFLEDRLGDIAKSDYTNLLKLLEVQLHLTQAAITGKGLKAG